MPNPQWTLKRGDEPVMVLHIDLESGGVTAPLDLTDCTAVAFILKPVPTTAEPNPATVVAQEAGAAIHGDPTNGELEYDFSRGGSAIAGSFYAEFELVIAGEKITYPEEDSYIEVTVWPDLGDVLP